MRFGKLSTSVTLESFNNGPMPSVGLFYYGCNFRCGFCHNHIMLGTVNSSELMTEEHLNKILKNAKRTWKEMIVIGGGEPTLSPELPELLRYLKNDWDFKIKLDTNGSNPEVLQKLIDEGLIDYIAMDIKGTKEQYFDITKYSNLENIEKSIEIIKQLPNYEFRTTVLPNFHDEESMEEIGKWLKGAKKFYLQQFRPDLANGCLDESYCKLQKMPKEKLEEFAKVMKPYIDEVLVR